MRYAKIDEHEVVNGSHNGMSLYVQGCHFRCPNCFNSEAHDFNGGREWTQEVKEDFLRLAERPYIKRISILGGEPLADENLDEILKLINEIRISFPLKDIWLYSGYTFEQAMYPVVTDDFNPIRDEMINKRRTIVEQCDVFVDGRYIDSQRDVAAKWRGSTNQKIWKNINGVFHDITDEI